MEGGREGGRTFEGGAHGGTESFRSPRVAGVVDEDDLGMEGGREGGRGG